MRQVNNLGTAFIDDAESTFLPHCSCEWKGTVPINSLSAFKLIYMLILWKQYD